MKKRRETSDITVLRNSVRNVVFPCLANVHISGLPANYLIEEDSTNYLIEEDSTNILISED